MIRTLFILILTIHQYSSPVAHYKRVIELNPKDIEAYKNLGIHYKENKEYDEAIKCLKQGLNIATGDTELLYQLGISYYLKGDYRGAEVTFHRIIKYVPTPDAYFNLGAVLTREKKYEEAVKTFKKALNLKPDDIEVLFHLAGIYLVMGKYEPAINTYTEIIDLVPEDPRAYEGRASAYWKIGDKKLSRKDIKQAKELRTGVYFGEAHEFKPKEKKKKKEKETPEIYTRDPEVLSYVGEMHQATGEWELAVETYTAAIKLNPNNLKYYKERAKAYKELGKIEEAEADLKKAKELEK